MDTSSVSDSSVIAPYCTVSHSLSHKRHSTFLPRLSTPPHWWVVLLRRTSGGEQPMCCTCRAPERSSVDKVSNGLGRNMRSQQLQRQLKNRSRRKRVKCDVFFGCYTVVKRTISTPHPPLTLHCILRTACLFIPCRRVSPLVWAPTEPNSLFQSDPWMATVVPWLRCSENWKLRSQ